MDFFHIETFARSKFSHETLQVRHPRASGDPSNGLIKNGFPLAKEALIYSIPSTVLQADNEWNHKMTVRPEPVEGFDQRFPNYPWLKQE